MRRIPFFTRKPRPSSKEGGRLTRRPGRRSGWLWFRPLPRLRLSHQLLGFFVLVVLLPLLALSLSIYGINQRALKKQVAHFATNTAQAIYGEFNLEMGWQKEHAMMAAQFWTLLDNEPSQQRRLDMILGFFGRYPDYEAIAEYDPHGRQTMVWYAPEAHYTIEQLAFPKTVDPYSLAVRFQLAHPDPAGKNPDLRYALRIHVPLSLVEGAGKTGSLVFYKRFSYLGDLMDKRFEAFHKGFVLVDEQGTMIAGPPAVMNQPLSNTDRTLFLGLKEGQMKTVSARQSSSPAIPSVENPLEDHPREKVFVKMPGVGWGLVIETPYYVERSFIQKARTQSVALVFLCILVIIVLGLLYSRGINRNFRQLIKGIKALAEGRYSRKIRLITKSWTPFEIVYLTAEVNRMATKISTAWSSIQKLNQELMSKNEQDLFIARAIQRLHRHLDLDTMGQTATQIFVERPEVMGAVFYSRPSETARWERQAVHLTVLAQAAPEFQALVFLDHVDLDALTQRCPRHGYTQAQIPSLPDDVGMTLHPIVYQQTTLGLLVLFKTRSPLGEQQPPENDLVIQLLCGQIGVAMHQARQWQALQKANQQLAKLDELKSNLIDTVSHELRTPLTNIKGYTSRLLRNEATLDPETKRNSLRVIKQQADRLGRMVEDLLVIPEIEQKEGIRVFPDRVNLAELLQRCVSVVEGKANRNIVVHELSANCDLLVDPDRMEQVILNLLDNAIKYSSPDQPIVLTPRLDPEDPDNRVTLDVFNTCEPITPEDLETLFTKFKRLDERLTRTTRGTGLGLFITKALVEAMGGTIRLEGHQGFRVMVSLPVWQGHPLPEAPVPSLV